MRSILTAAILAVTLSPAFAANGEKVALPDRFHQVCQSKARLSPKLSEACRTDAQPKALQDGSRFAAVGIGSELNTLYDNLDFFQK